MSDLSLLNLFGIGSSVNLSTYNFVRVFYDHVSEPLSRLIAEIKNLVEKKKLEEMRFNQSLKVVSEKEYRVQ